MAEQSIPLTLIADIVSAYVGKNSTRAEELPALISSVSAALVMLGSPPSPAEKPAHELKPAVPIEKSITHEHLISLEDGRRFRTLTRHLSVLGMTPDAYRTKWGLPKDYPMISPGYSAKRSEMVLSGGFGSRKLVNVESEAHTALTPLDSVQRQ